MNRALFVCCLLFCVASAALRLQAQTTAPAGDQDAQSMLEAYRSLQPPQADMSRKDDPAYVESYIKERNAIELQRAELAKAFHDKFPNHPLANEMMQQRWMALFQLGQVPTVLTETEQALADNPDPAAKPGILFLRAAALLHTGSDKASAAIDDFIKAAPDDPRGAELLFAQSERDTDQQLAIYRRILQAYPSSPYADMAKGALHRVESIGKPFELDFTDAISDRHISVQKDLKGKVVVIDFWATWCGPCVGEMPENKEIYAKYKDKGVEFIGVSLDQPEAQGGLKALKDFVAQNDITWPQYYQGNYWQSEFSSGWGIDSIPCVFIVDADGKLYSVTARGQLDDLIPKLLAKRDQKP